MSKKIKLFYRGSFGRRVAVLAAKYGECDQPVDLDAEKGFDRVADCQGASALVLLSDASTEDLKALAEKFRDAKVSWTSVYLYPTMIRIGPLVKKSGVCFTCSTRRYLSMPGSSGLARLETLLQNPSAGDPLYLEGFPASAVVLSALEAMRQISDANVPAGFIRKIELVENRIDDAVALPVHGCSCSSDAKDSSQSGERFYRNLERDLHTLLGEHVQ